MEFVFLFFCVCIKLHILGCSNVIQMGSEDRFVKMDNCTFVVCFGFCLFWVFFFLFFFPQFDIKTEDACGTVINM